MFLLYIVYCICIHSCGGGRHIPTYAGYNPWTIPTSLVIPTEFPKESSYRFVCPFSAPARWGSRFYQSCFLLPSLPFPSLPFPSLPFPSLPFPSFPSLPFPSLPFPSLPFPSLPSFLPLAVEVRQCPCQRGCQNRCQIECQNECQIEGQKIHANILPDGMSETMTE